MQTITDKIVATKDGAIGRMVLNNPERHNAISLEMWQAMPVVLDDFANDPEIRVIVVSGAGGKAFSAGADISQFEESRSSEGAVAEFNATFQQACKAVTGFAKPTIARIEGYCIGGGLALALSCDLRLAGDDAQFGIPAAKLGLGYEFEGIRTLVELVGPAYTQEIFFTARRFNATEAREMGLVNRVLPYAALAAYVEDYAQTIAGNAPLTVQSVKKIVAEVLKDPEARDLELCRALVRACDASEDYAEGRQAFMEKRKPAFVGR